MKKEVKYISVALAKIFLICFNTVMAQDKKDTNGQTILKYNTINANFGLLSGRAKIIEATANYLLISLDGELFMLLATPEFNRSKWWLEHQHEIGKIKRLVIQPSFQYEKLKDRHCELPIWVANFKSLTYLMLNQVFIERLDLMENTEVNFLEFSHVVFRNEETNKLVEDIKKMKHLKGIAYDDSVPLEIVRILKAGCMNCKFYFVTNEDQKQKLMHDLNINL